MRVTFLSDLFSTVREILFFSPLITSVGIGLGQQQNSRQDVLEDIRPKALSSGKDAVTRISGSVRSTADAVEEIQVQN
jgi:hypothetical protein